MTELRPDIGTPRAARLRRELRAWRGELADLALPRACPGCGGPEPWCAGCDRTLRGRPRTVRFSDTVLDAAAGVPLPVGYALTAYAGPARQAVLAAKERNRRDLAAPLGRALAEAVRHLLAVAVVPNGAAGDPAGDAAGDSGGLWLVPAPGRAVAARRRGGDPVTAMTRVTARRLAATGRPCGVARCLVTAAGAADSVGLGAADRLANLTGRVRVRAAGRPPPGETVVVIDDVLTTGATVLAAQRAMLAADRTITVWLTVTAASAALHPVR
ncbi:ComF family protein [Nakamurella leprariae]|uniref:ComF family protein n=1 Tax=Nakamurella leprariae TaxID=2803911 RepID=A0A938YH12_9ACTN|nr:ComF family protein [Nakamurella leprariae]MBM9468217.1 ComF family protein [Nakamurella leprariae]